MRLVGKEFDNLKKAMEKHPNANKVVLKEHPGGGIGIVTKATFIEKKGLLGGSKILAEVDITDYDVW